MFSFKIPSLMSLDISSNTTYTYYGLYQILLITSILTSMRKWVSSRRSEDLPSSAVCSAVHVVADPSPDPLPDPLMAGGRIASTGLVKSLLRYFDRTCTCQALWGTRWGGRRKIRWRTLRISPWTSTRPFLK